MEVVNTVVRRQTHLIKTRFPLTSILSTVFLFKAITLTQSPTSRRSLFFRATYPFQHSRILTQRLRSFPVTSLMCVTSNMTQSTFSWFSKPKPYRINCSLPPPRRVIFLPLLVCLSAGYSWWYSTNFEEFFEGVRCLTSNKTSDFGGDMHHDPDHEFLGSTPYR